MITDCCIDRVTTLKRIDFALQRMLLRYAIRQGAQ
jgi:hypothetical protein